MLPPILNSPEWFFSPTVIKNRNGGRPLPFAHYAWASFHFELCEGHIVSEDEVFAWVQGAGPLAGVVRGQRPLD